VVQHRPTGRVIAGAGNPKQAMTFYFGACAGSIRRTVDGGLHWRCVSGGYFGSAAIRAIVVAPWDPSLVYAGRRLGRSMGLFPR